MTLNLQGKPTNENGGNIQWTLIEITILLIIATTAAPIIIGILWMIKNHTDAYINAFLGNLLLSGIRMIFHKIIRYIFKKFISM